MKKILLTLFAATTGILGFSQCSDLFFSEYIEGSSNEKAIEIYNPTSSAVNLSNYKIMRANNGSTTYQDSVTLSGMLAPGAVYIAGNPSATASITSLADTLHTITFFNGDDVLHLKKISTGAIIDVIGELGVDPGTNWPVGSGATSEFTLVRMITIQQGTTSWASGATQWDVYPQNTYTYLGSHTMNSCVAPTDTIVSFSPNADTYNEGAVATLNLNLGQAATIASSVTVVLKSGDPADVNSFGSQVVNFPATTTTGSVNITVTDDILNEGTEVLTFAIRNASSSLLIGADSIFTLNINPSDVPWNPGLPFYSIAEVRGTNAQGQPDSNTVLCGVGGTVYGVNFRTVGLSFFINDETAGMNVFSPSSTFGYNVTEGDSVVVYGEVAVFRGLAQMAFLDSILVISNGNPIPNPLVVTALNESTEGELIRINGLTLVTPAQWTNNVNGFTVDATNGSTTFQVRIERNTTAIPMPAPTVPFDVIGIGSQFATTTVAPFTDGYQIIPRKIEDVILLNSIEDESGWNISLFPNPTSGILNILSAFDNYHVQIMDLTGKVVLQKNNANANTQVDMTSLSAGIYLVKLNNGASHVTKKVILKK